MEQVRIRIPGAIDTDIEFIPIIAEVDGPAVVHVQGDSAGLDSDDGVVTGLVGGEEGGWVADVLGVEGSV